MSTRIRNTMSLFILCMAAMIIISFFTITWRNQDVYVNMQLEEESYKNGDNLVIPNEESYLNDINAKIKYLMQLKNLNYNSSNELQQFVNKYITHSTAKPTAKPTANPTVSPTVKPTSKPQNPTHSPTQSPTTGPTPKPRPIQYVSTDTLSLYSNMASVSENIIPLSWQELSTQQFCTLESETTDDNRSLQEFLQFIYSIQFGQACDDPSHKFVIYQIELEAKQGLGASLLGNIKRFFAATLQLNRTFILSGAHDWAAEQPYCEGTEAMECYFLPVSNCRASDILSQIDVSDPTQYHSGVPPNDCIFGNNAVQNKNITRHCEQRVIHISVPSRNYIQLNGEIRQWTFAQFELPMMAYESMVTAFFMRPQPKVRQIIYEKIRKSIETSFEGTVPTFGTNTLIAYPIRASDKCDTIGKMTGKHYTHSSEITCFTPIEHVRVMNSVQYFTNDKIDTVIFTSEDESFLNKVVALMQDRQISNVSHWRVIRNTEDYSVGEGTTTFKRTVKVYNQSLRTGVGSSLEKDHIVSALSSLVLQVHFEPEYIVYGDSSTWLKLMWKWLAHLNCNIEPHWHVRGGSDNKCIELATPGYLHFYGKFAYKFVRYSKAIWERIHSEGLTPQIFAERFKINITRFGWDKYCEQGFKNKLKFRR